MHCSYNGNKPSIQVIQKQNCRSSLNCYMMIECFYSLECAGSSEFSVTTRWIIAGLLVGKSRFYNAVEAERTPKLQVQVF